MDADEYVRTYSQPVLVTPTWFLPWRGRTTPEPARALEGLRGVIARWTRSLRPAFAGA